MWGPCPARPILHSCPRYPPSLYHRKQAILNRRLLVLLVLAAMGLAALVPGHEPQEEPRVIPAHTPSPTLTPSPTVTTSSTPMPSPSPSPSHTPSPTPTSAPADTATPAPTDAPTPEPSSTPQPAAPTSTPPVALLSRTGGAAPDWDYGPVLSPEVWLWAEEDCAALEANCRMAHAILGGESKHNRGAACGDNGASCGPGQIQQGFENGLHNAIPPSSLPPPPSETVALATRNHHDYSGTFPQCSSCACSRLAYPCSHHQGTESTWLSGN